MSDQRRFRRLSGSLYRVPTAQFLQLPKTLDAADPPIPNLPLLTPSTPPVTDTNLPLTWLWEDLEETSPEEGWIASVFEVAVDTTFVESSVSGEEVKVTALFGVISFPEIPYEVPLSLAEGAEEEEFSVEGVVSQVIEDVAAASAFVDSVVSGEVFLEEDFEDLWLSQPPEEEVAVRVTDGGRKPLPRSRVQQDNEDIALIVQAFIQIRSR